MVRKQGLLSRKAGQAAFVPIVIIAIALFMIVYLYSLPKAEKCELMPDLSECGVLEKIVEIETLLSDTPGYLESRERSAVYAIKPVEIFSQEDVEIATILENKRVSKSWFSRIDKKGTFNVNPKGKELKLFIYLSEGKGKLKVNINPKLSYTLEGTGVHEISLPITLVDELNIIRFSSSLPWFPPETNYFEIEKVIIKETYSLTDLYEKRNLSIEQDLKNLKQATLSFGADCITKELLAVSLNDVQLSKKITCEEVSLDIKDEIKNENEFLFSTMGNYLVHPIKVNLYFEKGDFTTYYIELDKEEARDLRQGKILAMLQLLFDSSEKKEFDVVVNEDVLTTESDEIEFKMRINDYLMEGLNKVKIIPRDDIMLRKLKVYLE